ncbi:hypothetical protein [Bradyrhizobium sp. 162]|uniref:hypothetical protein n=1 Tax=Bradyrhizobium sp. 162 TaxID=2782635 RepID=UPI001FF81BB2|nr:hypothetical protein [Bradyrhizobium sp. 162]MCK1635908.1 hypothetical protein [Bradyrhizobium sp. 162]
MSAAITQSRQRSPVVFAGPTDAELFGLEIALGKAVVGGHSANVKFYYDKIVVLKATGTRRPGTKRSFTRTELIELKIARAYLASHGENVRYLIGERAKQIASETQKRR